MKSSAVPVSCIITCYNNAATVGRAVASVALQSKAVEEIIVVDDASTDDSAKMLACMSASISNLRVMRNHTRLGVAANRDRGIRAATQPFVTHLDGDDVFGPRKVEREWQVLSDDRKAVAFSNIVSVPVDQPWKTRVLDPRSTVGSRSSSQRMNYLATRRGTIPRDMMLAKSLFEEVGGLDSSFPIYEDWHFKLRLAALGVPWRYSGAVGTFYFRRRGSLSGAEKSMHVEWRRKAIAYALDEIHFCLDTTATFELVEELTAANVGKKRATESFLADLKKLVLDAAEFNSEGGSRNRKVELLKAVFNSCEICRWLAKLQFYEARHSGK